MRSSTGLPGTDLAPLLESTLLRPEAKAEEIDFLCREAIELGLLAVVVQPVWVEKAVAALAGTPVMVVTVAGFPLGGSDPRVKAREAELALGRGAREVDFAIPVGLLRSGDDRRVGQEMQLMAEVARGRGLVKAILECALLNAREMATACHLAEKAGVDFVKTSTGYGPRGASLDDVKFMRQSLGAAVRVKAAGGIRDLAMARAMVAAGAARIGTSSAARIVRGEHEEQARELP